MWSATGPLGGTPPPYHTSTGPASELVVPKAQRPDLTNILSSSSADAASSALLMLGRSSSTGQNAPMFPSLMPQDATAMYSMMGGPAISYTTSTLVHHMPSAPDTQGQIPYPMPAQPPQPQPQQQVPPSQLTYEPSHQMMFSQQSTMRAPMPQFHALPFLQPPGQPQAYQSAGASSPPPGPGPSNTYIKVPMPQAAAPQMPTPQRAYPPMSSPLPYSTPAFSQMPAMPSVSTTETTAFTAIHVPFSAMQMPPHHQQQQQQPQQQSPPQASLPLAPLNQTLMPHTQPPQQPQAPHQMIVPLMEPLQEKKRPKKPAQPPKKFPCPTCHKTFTGHSGLVRHVRTHTGENPFVCSECGKGFKQKGTLTSHLRIHSGDTPFQCDRCHIYFRHRGSMKRHRKRCTATPMSAAAALTMMSGAGPMLLGYSNMMPPMPMSMPMPMPAVTPMFPSMPQIPYLLPK